MDEKRLRKLLQSTIRWIIDDCSDFFSMEVDNEYDWFERAIGIKKDELLELGFNDLCGDYDEERGCYVKPCDEV